MPSPRKNGNFFDAEKVHICKMITVEDWCGPLLITYKVKFFVLFPVLFQVLENPHFNCIRRRGNTTCDNE
jgi:hypothetical protein